MFSKVGQFPANSRGVLFTNISTVYTEVRTVLRVPSVISTISTLTKYCLLVESTRKLI